MDDGRTLSFLNALKLDENPLINQFMFVEELNNADGSFVISSIIKTQIEKNQKIILILSHNSFGHYHSISQKLGFNLMSVKDSGDVFVINILEKIVKDDFLNCKEPLRQLYGEIKNQICEWGSENGVCVVLENIGNLLLIEMKDIFVFINYVRTVALEGKNSSVLCSIHNFQSSSNVDRLAKAVKHFSDVIVILNNLETGRANDVTGHLSVKRREKKFKTCSWEYQYQLQDKSFIVFAPGFRNFL